MTDPIMLENAIEAMIVLNATVTNLRLYPPTSDMIGNSIDRAYTILQTIFEKEDSVVLAESEKNLIISGQALNEKDQKRPQVTAFVQLMVNFGIKSIAFEKGLDKEELLNFLKIFSQKPENVTKEGGLQKVMASNNLRHVLLDEKLYVAVDKDQRIVSADEAIDKDKDENIIKFIMGDADSGIDPESFRDAAKDPKWVAEVFKTGIAQITQQEGATPSKKLSEAVIHMINTLGEVVDSNSKEEISMQIVNSIADMDDETLSMVLTQNPQGVLGEDFFDNVVDQLDDKKFDRLASKIKQLEESATAGKGALDPSGAERRSGEDRRRTHSLEYLLKSGIDRRKRKDPRKSRVMQVKAGLNSILKGEDKAFLDSQVMLSVPSTVEQLFSKGKNKIAEGIIDRLGEGLLNEKTEVRAAVSTVLAQINLNFASKQRMDEILKLSHKLISWIKFETTVNPAYKHICNQLKAVAQALIRNYQFDECNQVLETFHLIHSGKMKKSEEIQALSGNVLKSTATDDILDLLLEEFETDEKNLREQAANTLTMLGSNSVGPLLDILRDSQDLSEHDRISQIVSEIGPSASLFLAQQIEQGGPSHYLCNLILLLGKVGTEDDLTILKTSLDHEDSEVQAAAESALEMIMEKGTKPAKPTPSEKKEITPSTDKETIESKKTEPAEDDLTQQIKLVDQHVQQNDTKSAVKILFDLIVKYAKEKDFSKAELLREKLLEVDPMALTEIVKAGEIIEEEKSESIDQDHLAFWKKIYDTFNNEEANALYYAMKSDTCNADQTIISQGELNSKLYFIDEGQLKMVFHKEGEEFLIKELNPGDIVGDDSFFYMTVCTTSVITLSLVEFHFLEKESLKKWEEEFPALASKLTNYCLGFEKIHDLLEKKALDRRSQERVKIPVKMSIKSMDDSGVPMGKAITGTLADISEGGLSFYIKTSKERATSMFMGPKLNMQFTLPTGESQHQIDQNGTVVGVHYHLYDYSINVKLDKMLDEKIITEIEVPEHADEKILEME